MCEWENVLTTFGIHNKSELHQMVLILGRDCGPRGPGRLEVERRMSRSLLLSLSEVQTNASEARTATSLHSAESCAARISLGTRIELREFKSSRVKSSQVKPSLGSSCERQR